MQLGPGAAPTPSPSAVPKPSKDPIESIFAQLTARLIERTKHPDATLTCNDLLDIIGPGAHVLAIFVFSMLNLLPAPPGYNFFMALIIAVLSTAMLFGRQIHLGGFIGRMKLPTKLLIKLLGLLSKLTSWIARISDPRLQVLTTPATGPVIALAGITFGVAMLLPIPFTNMLPSIGLAMICIGQLNRDGLMLIGGILVGALGLVVMAAAIWAIIALAVVIEDVVDPDDDISTGQLDERYEASSPSISWNSGST